MPVVAKRYKVKFEEGNLRFSEAYPNALEGVLPLAEFDSVVRKVNEDMTVDIRETNQNVRKWAIATISLCIVVVGLFMTPVLFVKTRRQKQQLKEFWERLRMYLGEINRKTYMKRNLEWKLVEDKRKLKGRDVVNPMFAYRIEIIHRIPKTKTTKPAESEMSMSAVAAGAAAGRPATSLSGVSTSSKSPSLSTGSMSERDREGRLSDEEDAEDVQGEVVVLEEAEYPNADDDIIIEEADEDDYADEDAGILASVSSVGAGSYSRGSLIITPAALAVAASQERSRESTGSDAVVAPVVPPPVKIIGQTTASESESMAGSESVGELSAKQSGRQKKRSSRVRFTGLFDDEDDEEIEDVDVDADAEADGGSAIKDQH